MIDIELESFKARVEMLYEDAVEHLYQHAGKLILLLALISIGFYLLDYMIPIILLAMISAVSIMTTRLELNSLGIELTTFSTVLMGVVSGPETGALLGLLFILTELFTGNPPGVYIIWVVPGYAAAGYLAGMFAGTGIILLGSAMTIGLQSVFLLCTSLIMRDKVPRYLQFSVFNIVFNALLFTAIGPEALELLSALA